MRPRCCLKSQRSSSRRWLVLSDTVVDTIRRELRRLSPGVKIEQDEIRGVLTQEVLKREVVEGDKADDARRKVNRVAGKAQRARSNDRASSSDGASGAVGERQQDIDDESTAVDA